MNNIFDSFIKNNGSNFDEILSDLLNYFKPIKLDNLNTVYNDTLFLIFKNIDDIIENNDKLGTEYLNNVKNTNSYHITQGFIDKYNIYILIKLKSLLILLKTI